MKFAGLFRGWRHRSDENQAAEKSAQIAAPVPPAAFASSTVETREPSPMQTWQPAPVAPPLSRPQISNEVEMPLRSILEKLPQDLRAKMTMRLEDLGEASIAISTEQILPQLARGSVKIMFGQLRGAMPDLFSVTEEYDSLPIVLPLNILLARLNPNLLPRNPHQKSLDVPSDIKGPFGARAEGVSFATNMMKGPPATTPPTRMTAPLEGQTKIHARMVAPPPPAFTRPVAPIAPPVTPAAPVALPPVAAPLMPPAKPMMPVAPRVELPPVAKPIPFTAPLPIAPPKPVVPVAPTAPPIPIAPVVPAVPITSAVPVDATTIHAPLAGLSEKWPEPLKEEIAQLNLAGAQVSLPMNLIEPALKRGRIIFPWQNLRLWMTPRLSGASAHDGIELELPLKVIVPLFLERHKPRPQLRISIDRSIPNLFFGFPSAEMEAPVAAPIAEVPPEPSPRPAPKSVDAKIADTNYYVWGDTSDTPRVDESEYKPPQTPDTDLKKRLATPKEIVERAMTIAGVVGAVITLPDGLKVAAQVPPELNPDMVAAFIPQIFDRVGQSTRELRMGVLNNLKFTVGNVPWKIFRVNAVYFAAFGRQGERLPTAELAKLAAELDRKTK